MELAAEYKLILNSLRDREKGFQQTLREMKAMHQQAVEEMEQGHGFVAGATLVAIRKRIMDLDSYIGCMMVVLGRETDKRAKAADGQMTETERQRWMMEN